MTLWTVAHQVPLSTKFFRQEYWSGLPCPPPGGFPNPGIKPVSPVSPALAGRFSTTEPPKKPFRDAATMLLLLLLLSCFSHVQLCATPWTAAYQAPPSVGFSRQKYWSGVPLPSPVFQYRLLQMLNNHICLVPTVLDSANLEGPV